MHVCLCMRARARLAGRLCRSPCFCRGACVFRRQKTSRRGCTGCSGARLLFVWLLSTPLLNAQKVFFGESCQAGEGRAVSRSLGCVVRADCMVMYVQCWVHAPFGRAVSWTSSLPDAVCHSRCASCRNGFLCGECPSQVLAAYTCTQRALSRLAQAG